MNLVNVKILKAVNSGIDIDGNFGRHYYQPCSGFGVNKISLADYVNNRMSVTLRFLYITKISINEISK